MVFRRKSSEDRIYLYDTTLRDGAQTRGVDFSVADKIALAKALDDFGMDYIEAGWPGANPTDTAFFANPPKLKNSKLTAFGMTRRSGRSASNDTGLNALLDTPAKSVCMVGKTWDFHVTSALEVPLEENLKIISESVKAAVAKKLEVIFDAEHFFDGYKANAEFALKCVKAAYDAGARWIVLCDTNGGTLPFEISAIVSVVSETIPGENLGIHCHDDTGNGVANSLAAIQSGARMVQGTLNGLGERCGNANLITIIPTLMLKMRYKTGISEKGLEKLTELSRALDERLNRLPDESAPYVGKRAFTHKGGLHVSAIQKNPKSYEHISPYEVGNERQILISDQAGKSNILNRLHGMGIKIDADDERLNHLLTLVKKRDSEGYAYDLAEASFEILVRRMLEKVPQYFDMERFTATDERRYNARGKLVTESEAVVKIRVGENVYHTVADGNGPVHALDVAMRRALEQAYPVLKKMQLTDYKVRILHATDATAAMPRVQIVSRDDKGNTWTTIGVSTNIIEASYEALQDSFYYMLLKNKVLG